ncbi:hypothetical protein SERLA73DRAFT_190900 [Serpula lacrymans var. lacrymans S7.3]|uniref:F-box domain-containing protein n=2 Tax=Serpula lacrymans var. lacrymans TaxID=341189 RepID=F8QGL1_SERL3|nr:uncharacterized protein SERLADRAFT_456877 [Serpula lacrymans var. lacrymans S7.9]EGN92557.1 hypothetical protein SERLA73DRAFT_190900 [Serpula lacrymans var. lacrymans S7.3]EGO29304.1 hypothetical protein SERLADRAFT_456877 [Serpula lacrymans var. lacrymans S7.9]
MPRVDLNSLPNELWLAVFESLTNPGDLCRVVRTCQRFHDLAIRVLYRHIVWDDPRWFATNFPYLLQHPEINSVPRSLTLGISQIQYNGSHVEQMENIRAIVDVHGDLRQPGPAMNHGVNFEEDYLSMVRSRREPIFVASVALYSIVRDCINAFSMLVELNFKNVLLPNDLYQMIHQFSRLRRLQIDHCTLPLSPTLIPSHRNLPITELTLLGLRGNREAKVLSLATAQNLRVLRFDWTAAVFRIFTDNSVKDPVPPHLEIIDAKFPPHKRWPSNPADAEESFIQPFKSFLAMCPFVTRLHIRNHFPAFSMTPDILPRLTYYQGPLSTVATVSVGRPVVALDIRDPSGSLRNLTNGLQAVSANQPELEELCIFLYQWDDEILYAITHHFTNLRKIQIRYFRGTPSEDIILGMGSRFFFSLPQLHTAHIFKTLCDADERQNMPTHHFHHHHIVLIEPVPETDEDNEGDYEMSNSHNSTDGEEENELKSLILAWNRYCPSIREIQLLPGFVWRRSNEKDEWCKRRYKMAENQRDYNV